MPGNYMLYKNMGDLSSTTCSSSLHIRLHPQAAFKQTSCHFMLSQKRYNGRSFATHFEFKTIFARPREHSNMVPVHSLAFALVTGESHVHSEEEKAGNLIEPASGDEKNEETKISTSNDIKENEETHSTSKADHQTSLHVMATPDDDKEGHSLAGLNESEKLVFTTEMLQADNTDKLSRSGHAHSDAIDTPSEAQKERMMKKKTQQLTYLFAALASSVGITSLAGASVYYRFAWQMQGGEVPWTEMCGTFSLALGAAVGMEYWARWAHRVLWHASLWSMHESHHQPRDGPFELNDMFAIINAVPAIALMAFGFLNKGLVPGLCFGSGLGITMFGIAYMFVHDGLVHRRFPVGPIAGVSYFQKVAAAHQLHHADKFNGVPYGLFLGPMELEEVGEQSELEKLLQKREREKKANIDSKFVP